MVKSGTPLASPSKFVTKSRDLGKNSKESEMSQQGRYQACFNKLLASYVLKGKTKLSGETLKQFLMTKLPAWQVPREWWLVESLETNHRGKISRAEWRKRYLEQGAKR